MPVEAPYQPAPGLLFFAVLWREDQVDEKELQSLLSENFGNIVQSFHLKDHQLSDYYRSEMGTPLGRCYFVIDRLVERLDYPDLKKESMSFEKDHSYLETRKINLDPGLICSEQLLLISTKPYSHRIFARENLYIELTYTFKKSYQVLPWTYPDYQREEVISFFNEVRGKVLCPQIASLS